MAVAVQTTIVKGHQICALFQKIIIPEHQIKMYERVVKICRYYNFGYCRYTKKNGMHEFHPKDDCQVLGCRGTTFPNRHPKTCKLKDECRL